MHDLFSDSDKCDQVHKIRVGDNKEMVGGYVARLADVRWMVGEGLYEGTA